MRVALLDVNVLVALAWPNHIHHEIAVNWFIENSRGGWSTCPLTQCGFVRVSSNPAMIREAVSPLDAANLLDEMTQHETHVFWPDDLSISESLKKLKLLSGHRQVTDAYLLGLALHQNGRLATFDKGIAAIASGAGYATSIVLIETRASRE